VRFIPVPAEDAGLQPSSAALEADIATTASEKMKGAMSNFSRLARSHEQWARFRFSVIGPLLAHARARALTHCQSHPGAIAHRSPGPVRTAPLSQPPA
jgi:hypothetical protein